MLPEALNSIAAEAGVYAMVWQGRFTAVLEQLLRLNS